MSIRRRAPLGGLLVPSALVAILVFVCLDEEPRTDDGGMHEK